MPTPSAGLQTRLNLFGGPRFPLGDFSGKADASISPTAILIGRMTCRYSDIGVATVRYADPAKRTVRYSDPEGRTVRFGDDA